MITEIPPEIVLAAQTVQEWFAKQSATPNSRWELMGICSRNHAESARELAECLKKYQARYHHASVAKMDWDRSNEALKRWER